MLKIAKEQGRTRLFQNLFFYKHRQNKKKLWNFIGFQFQKEDDEFIAELQDITDNILKLDLINITNLSATDTDEEEETFARKILIALTDDLEAF